MKKLLSILAVFFIIQFCYVSCAQKPNDTINVRLEKKINDLQLRLEKVEDKLEITNSNFGELTYMVNRQNEIIYLLNVRDSILNDRIKVLEGIHFIRN